MAPGTGFLYLEEMQPMQVLLINPPIYDFTAYDFWLRPYGMLRVAGRIRHCCRLSFFDYLVSERRDAWGRGRFASLEIPKPKSLSDIPRRFRRFGKPRSQFREFLNGRSFDVALIQTMMTYWYPGIREVIEDLRELQPSCRIVLGGVYATLCPSHARSLDADLVVEGSDLAPLWRFLSIEPEEAIPFWPPESGEAGVLKITEGCPYACTYCSAPLLWSGFTRRPTSVCLDELGHMVSLGLRNVAFYDDALLYQPEMALVPFLENVLRSNFQVSFHTPNALNARFVTPELARLMLRAGFASFFFGLESSGLAWQRSTGGKVSSEEFSAAVGYLREAGAGSIVTYVILGHPDSDGQELESSIHFAHKCGTRVLLSEFSPIPGTPDGEKSRKWAELEEPLSHNKTAFAIRRLGEAYVNDLKQQTRRLNASLIR